MSRWSDLDKSRQWRNKCSNTIVYEVPSHSRHYVNHYIKSTIKLRQQSQSRQPLHSSQPSHSIKPSHFSQQSQSCQPSHTQYSVNHHVCVNHWFTSVEFKRNLTQRLFFKFEMLNLLCLGVCSSCLVSGAAFFVSCRIRVCITFLTARLARAAKGVKWPSGGVSHYITLICNRTRGSRSGGWGVGEG